MDGMESLKNAAVEFGLEAQGHIPTILRMLQEGCTWDAIAKSVNWDRGQWRTPCEPEENDECDDEPFEDDAIDDLFVDDMSPVPQEVDDRLTAVERDLEQLKSANARKKEIPNALPSVMTMTESLFPSLEVKFEIVDGVLFGDSDYILITVKCTSGMTADEIAPAYLLWHSRISECTTEPELFRLTMDFTE